MQIQINTDAKIEGTEDLATQARAVVEAALERFANDITRVEVHLSDPTGGHGETKFRCVLEARPAGRNPTAVTDHAATVDQAVRGAAEKMKHVLGRDFDRVHEHRPLDPIDTDERGGA